MISAYTIDPSRREYYARTPQDIADEEAAFALAPLRAKLLSDGLYLLEIAAREDALRLPRAEAEELLRGYLSDFLSDAIRG